MRNNLNKNWFRTLLSLFLAVSLCLSKGSAFASNFPHIRTHADYYRYDLPSLPSDEREAELSFLANHYDLVTWPYSLGVYQPLLKSYNPNCKSTVYTNYTNIYKYEPLMWNHFKQWSDSYAGDYESLFLHFKKDHTKVWPYDEGSTYEEQFDRVWTYDGSSYFDRSWAAWDPGMTFQFLTGTNAILYLGYSEGKYKEIDFDLSTFTSGLNIIWEYWNGTSWHSLSVNDGTNNMIRNGKVEFFPPKDWQKTKVNTDEWEYYYIRLRCSAVTVAPTAVTIMAEDFVKYDGIGFQIKGWDPINDQNSDSFVDDDEYGNLQNPQATARFKYQARYAYAEDPRYYGRRWILDIGNKDVRNWNYVWVPYLLNSQDPKYDGVGEDNAFISTETLEPLCEYASDEDWVRASREILSGIDSVVGDDVLVINLGNYRSAVADSYGQLVDIMFSETWIRADFEWSTVQANLNAVKDRVTKLGISNYVEAMIARTVDISEDRNRIYCLANYYLMAYDLPSGHTAYYYGSRGYRDKDVRVYNWYGAIEYNIGVPVGDYYVWASGYDPEKPEMSYRIFARQYTGALVLLKPRSYRSSPWELGNVGDASGTMHALGGVYCPLGADGTLGAQVSQITLRNAEGAILIKTPSTLLGDVNLDGKVDIKDLILVAKDFGKTTGFNPGCDVNGDARVDIKDLIIVAKNFGKKL